MDFQVFKIAVAKQFEEMKKHELFRTDVEKDKMWETYLGSFPAGSDPIYRERTEHDCNCCKQFIRAVGNVVAIVDGKLVSIWDVKGVSEEYQIVADALSVLVKSGKVSDIFLHFEKVAGTDKNFEDATNGVKTWNHFFINIPPKYVVAGHEIASRLAGPRDSQGVLLRGLNELSVDALDTVLELISQNSLYRGEEHKFAVETFMTLKTEYDKILANFDETLDASLLGTAQELFAWTKISTTPESVCRFRGTSIGTLAVDLSGDVGLDDAVKKFEHKVAGPNYKRPTALVTKGMLDKARKTIEALGLTSALTRRRAKIDDITINNILHANRPAKKAMSADIFDDLSAAISSKKPKNFDKVEEVSIEKFLSDILPQATSLEVMFENRHAGNLVSLIAPEDPTAGNLFKWGNNFSWSYNGDMADSVKERVKAAGGQVEGDLCCRLAWEYRDDLDFHMYEPDGYHISFSNRRTLSSCGGILDLDANGADGQRDDPSENIFYSDRRKMKEGIYTLAVNNYSRRSDGRGFVVQIEFDGQVHNINYEQVLSNGHTITVAKIKYSKANGFEIIESLPSSQSVRKVWNINSQNFHHVNVVMMSPNFWDGQLGIGNKHYFFMLEDCRDDGQARGFFNEFLKPELNEHRKVLEIVGAKMKTEVSDQQLSGLGFSSTKRDDLICRVTGAFTRTIKIVF